MMKTRLFYAIVALFLCAISFTTAQPRYRIAIRLLITNGTAACADTFGIAPGATFGIDSVLGERDQPPAPPPGNLFAVFTEDVGLGTQTLQLDLHPARYSFGSNPDSFYLHFQRADDSSITVFHWDRNYLALHTNSCILIDGGWNLNPIDMRFTDSMVVPAGQPSRRNKVYFDWAIMVDWQHLGEEEYNAPTVWTGNATSITSNSSVLAGQVLSSSTSATAHFDWGTSTAYGNSTPNISVSRATDAQTITAKLSNLLPNARYYYRVVATNFVGTTYGSPAFFTTTKQTERVMVPLTLKNGFATWRDTFGIAIGATFGIDPALGEQDMPACTLPGVLFGVFLGDAGLGNQTLLLDYHPGSTTASSNPDSFYFAFTREFDSLPTIFHWDSGYLKLHANSCHIVDIGWNLAPIDMLATDSMVVPAGNPSRANLVYFNWEIDVDWKPIRFTDVETVRPIPKNFQLEQNYPNPFNPTTDVGFRIADGGFVTLKIYDLLGQEVATLVHERKAPGEYHVQWNASGMPSGIYFYRLDAGMFHDVKKLLLIR